MSNGQESRRELWITLYHKTANMFIFRNKIKKTICMKNEAQKFLNNRISKLQGKSYGQRWKE